MAKRMEGAGDGGQEREGDERGKPSSSTHSRGGDRKEKQCHGCNGFQPVAVISHNSAVLLDDKIERLEVETPGSVISHGVRTVGYWMVQKEACGPYSHQIDSILHSPVQAHNAERE